MSEKQPTCYIGAGKTNFALQYLLKIVSCNNFKLCSPYGLVNLSAVLTQRWHFDFGCAKIGMPQKGLKKDDGGRERREKISSKVFPSSPLQINLC